MTPHEERHARNTEIICGVAVPTNASGQWVAFANLRRVLLPLELLAVAGRLNEMGQPLTDSTMPLNTVRTAIEHVAALGGIAPRVRDETARYTPE